MDPETYATLVEALTADLLDAWAATTRLVGDPQVYGFGPYTHLDASYFVGTWGRGFADGSRRTGRRPAAALPPHREGRERRRRR
jgi:hypothetical protein